MNYEKRLIRAIEKGSSRKANRLIDSDKLKDEDLIQEKALKAAVKAGNVELVKKIRELYYFTEYEDAAQLVDLIKSQNSEEQPKLSNEIYEEIVKTFMAYCPNIFILFDDINDWTEAQIEHIVGYVLKYYQGMDFKQLFMYTIGEEDLFSLQDWLMDNKSEAIKEKFIEELEEAMRLDDYLLVHSMFEKNILDVKESGIKVFTWAATIDHPDLMKYLVEKGIDVRECGEEALLNACEYGNVDVVNYLISLGVEVNARNGAAINLALLNDRKNIASILIRAGAKASMKWFTKDD